YEINHIIAFVFVRPELCAGDIQEASCEFVVSFASYPSGSGEIIKALKITIAERDCSYSPFAVKADADRIGLGSCSNHILQTERRISTYTILIRNINLFIGSLNAAIFIGRSAVSLDDYS